jgi:hypothetical protein
LHAGRRFYLISNNTIVGTSIITHSIIPGSINIDGCHGPIIAHVKSKVDGKNNNGTGVVIASNKPFVSEKKFSDKPVDTTENDIFEKNARSVVDRIENYREEMKNQKVKKKTVCYSRDVDGDNKFELVGTVQYSNPDHHLFGLSVLLVLEKGDNGKYRTMYSNISGGGGDGIIYDRKVVGFFDFNCDGKEDILTEESGHEHQSVNIHLSNGKSYDNPWLGSWSGC